MDWQLFFSSAPSEAQCIVAEKAVMRFTHPSCDPIKLLMIDATTFKQAVIDNNYRAAKNIYKIILKSPNGKVR